VALWYVIFLLPPPNLIVIIIGDYADVFDAVMIVLAMFILNLVHPGTYLRDDYAALPLSYEP
jgi:hypothetical protein